MAYVLVAFSALLVGVMTHQARQTDFITLENENLNWTNNQGKWTVVNYFAEWCAPCLREIPELNDFYQQNRQNINMFAVSYDPLNEIQLAQLQKKYAIGFPIITTFRTSIPWDKPPSSLPTTFILNPKGELIKQLKGEQSADELLQTVETLKRL